MSNTGGATLSLLVVNCLFLCCNLFSLLLLYILDSNKNAYFNFGEILYERKFASMF